MSCLFGRATHNEKSSKDVVPRLQLHEKKAAGRWPYRDFPGTAGRLGQWTTGYLSAYQRFLSIVGAGIRAAECERLRLTSSTTAQECK